MSARVLMFTGRQIRTAPRPLHTLLPTIMRARQERAARERGEVLIAQSKRELTADGLCWRCMGPMDVRHDHLRLEERGAIASHTMCPEVRERA